MMFISGEGRKEVNRQTCSLYKSDACNAAQRVGLQLIESECTLGLNDVGVSSTYSLLIKHAYISPTLNKRINVALRP